MPILLLGVAAVWVMVQAIRTALPAGERPVLPLKIQASDAAGGPLQGVLVAFFAKDKVHAAPAYESRTDQGGVATLPAEHAAGDFYCVARHPDGLVTQGWVSQNDPGFSAPLEFSSPTVIRGLVRDGLGLPIEGAVVDARLAKGPPLEEVRTDRNGSFRLEKVSGALPFLTIRARHEGFADREVEWDQASGDEVHLEMTRTPPLRIRVVDPDGKPVANLPVRVVGRPELQRSTDGDGLLVYPGIDPETYLFLAMEHETWTYRSDGLRPEASVQDLAFEPPAVLLGRVLDRAGNAVDRVEIRHRHGPRAWVRARTDGSGHFRIGDLPSGEVDLLYELADGTVGGFTVELERGEQKSGYVLRLRG